MKYFPEGDPDVQETDASHCPTDPAGGNHSLQRMNAGFARGVQQKIVIAPVAHDPESALRNPWQEREHNADFQAEDDIEDDT